MARELIGDVSYLPELARRRRTCQVFFGTGVHLVPQATSKLSSVYYELVLAKISRASLPRESPTTEFW